MAEKTCYYCGWQGQAVRAAYLSGGGKVDICQDILECAHMSARSLWMDAEQERMQVQDAYENGNPLW